MKPLKAMAPDWYQKIWSLDIKNQSWVENTANEVDFLVQALGLTGSERILDMACGFGGHSLELARRGYSVVGVDITPAYVEDARRSAAKEYLDNAAFLQADVRALTFKSEFDVVLNLADGAIGYLENETENNKIFDQISRALKPGGKHFMEIANAEYAERHFPCTAWDDGEKELSLSRFEWDPVHRIHLFGGQQFAYGTPLTHPCIETGAAQRIYSLEELRDIFAARGMEICRSFCDYKGNPSSPNAFQLMVYSRKKEMC